MAKCELQTELIMRNAYLLWYQFIQLLTQSKSTVRSQKGKTLVGQLNCVRGWWGNSPPLCMVKNALSKTSAAVDDWLATSVPVRLQAVQNMKLEEVWWGHAVEALVRPEGRA